MRGSVVTRSFALVVAAALVASHAIVQADPGPRRGTGAALVLPAAGTTSGGGKFAGTLSVERFAARDDQVVAVGMITGTVVDATGRPVGTLLNGPIALPVTVSPAEAAGLSPAGRTATGVSLAQAPVRARNHRPAAPAGRGAAPRRHRRRPGPARQGLRGAALLARGLPHPPQAGPPDGRRHAAGQRRLGPRQAGAAAVPPRHVQREGEPARLVAPPRCRHAAAAQPVSLSPAPGRPRGRPPRGLRLDREGGRIRVGEPGGPGAAASRVVHFRTRVRSRGAAPRRVPGRSPPDGPARPSAAADSSSNSTQ